MNDRNMLLGILGGLGPMATVYFYEMLTSHTVAATDQDHIDIILSSRATTPDRTAFIIGKSDENPLPIMKNEAKRLENAGADLIVMPCNTAHYFIDGIRESISVPMLDIIEETCRKCAENGIGKVGLLATEGTVSTGSYQKRAEKYGIEIVVPDKVDQKTVSSIIYDTIKNGKSADMKQFSRPVESLVGQGCEKIILGCTELSLIKKQERLGSFFTDSLEVLAEQTILACKKTPKDFDF